MPLGRAMISCDIQHAIYCCHGCLKMYWIFFFSPNVSNKLILQQSTINNISSDGRPYVARYMVQVIYAMLWDFSLLTPIISKNVR